MGDAARRLRDSFVDAFESPNDDAPSLEQGKGGKAFDTASEADITPFQEAKTHYFANQKNTKRRDQREGVDYFATPEPLGFKMVEWAGMRPNDAALEPSAGHGAIGRYFPENVRATYVEPSADLISRLALRTNGKLRQQRFEALDEAANKFDTIVMNPPYGQGGATARDHLAKAMNHLENGGRIVALIPEGPAADAKIEALLYGKDNESVAALKEKLKKATGEDATLIRQRISQLTNFHVRASISLPTVVFERAGTSVKTRVLIIDRLDGGGAALRESKRDIDAETIAELFDRIENMAVAERPASPTSPEVILANNGVTVTDANGGFRVNGTKYAQRDLTSPIMHKHGGQWFQAGKYWFTTSDPSEDLAKALQGEPVEGLTTAEAAPATDNPDLISHTTQAGKVIRGVVRTDLSQDQAKAVDPYTFKKNGGWFIREAHLSKLKAADTPVFSRSTQPGTTLRKGDKVRVADGVTAGGGKIVGLTGTVRSKFNGDRYIVDVDSVGSFILSVDEVLPDGNRQKFARITEADNRQRVEQYLQDNEDALGAVDWRYAEPGETFQRVVWETVGDGTLEPNKLDAVDLNPSDEVSALHITSEPESWATQLREDYDRGGRYRIITIAAMPGDIVIEDVQQSLPSEIFGRKLDSGILVTGRPLLKRKSDGVYFSQGGKSAPTGASPAAVRAAVNRIKSKWKNAPRMVVFTGMDDPQVPESVRQFNADRAAEQEMLSEDPNAEPDQVGGFYHRGVVYINTEAIANIGDVEQVLRHETLGHAGLRALFGHALDGILDQVIASHRAAVEAKAEQYKLDMTKLDDARTAAEEVLAELAETRPNLAVVRRAVALIRRLLREMGIKLELSNNDIIAEYLIPARNFIERGQRQGTGTAGGLVPAFMKQGLPATITVDGVERSTTNSDGKPIHPTAEGVRNFWQWFGDSEVVDSKGRPLSWPITGPTRISVRLTRLNLARLQTQEQPLLVFSAPTII